MNRIALLALAAALQLLALPAFAGLGEPARPSTLAQGPAALQAFAPHVGKRGPAVRKKRSDKKSIAQFVTTAAAVDARLGALPVPASAVDKSLPTANDLLDGLQIAP